jgi:hypothetical protein
MSRSHSSRRCLHWHCSFCSCRSRCGAVGRALAHDLNRHPSCFVKFTVQGDDGTIQFELVPTLLPSTWQLFSTRERRASSLPFAIRLSARFFTRLALAPTGNGRCSLVFPNYEGRDLRAADLHAIQEFFRPGSRLSGIGAAGLADFPRMPAQGPPPEVRADQVPIVLQIFFLAYFSANPR